MAQEAFVLVVDDDPLILDLVSMRLEAAGYNVTTASDAWQEVIQAQALRLGLVITDVQMPGFGTGIDAYKRLRQLSPNLPIIFMTGMKLDDVKSHLPNPPDPRVRLLGKPINFDELRQMIKDLTGLDRPL
jgi:CheY-like chemotaxis protein